MRHIRDSLLALIKRYYSDQSDLPFPKEPFEKDWISACQRGDPDIHERIDWEPTRQVLPLSFSGIERGLELSIHPDIKAYYGSFWSAHLEAESSEGHVSLILLWNLDDFDRLLQNLIGHALAKRKLKQPMTVFFATTEPDSELFLSIDNESGKILLEEPGKAPIRTVNDCLIDFIDRLVPAARAHD